MKSWRYSSPLQKSPLLQTLSAAPTTKLGEGMCRHEGLEVAEPTSLLGAMELAGAVPRLPRPVLLPAVRCWLATHSKRYVRWPTRRFDQGHMHGPEPLVTNPFQRAGCAHAKRVSPVDRLWRASLLEGKAWQTPNKDYKEIYLHLRSLLLLLGRVCCLLSLDGS